MPCKRMSHGNVSVVKTIPTYLTTIFCHFELSSIYITFRSGSLALTHIVSLDIENMPRSSRIVFFSPSWINKVIVFEESQGFPATQWKIVREMSKMNREV